MKFTIGKDIAMDEVPVSTFRSSRGACEPLFEAIGALKRGRALPVSFPDKKSGLAARAALRKIATREKETLSSSRSADLLTFYFWIEPKEDEKQLTGLKRAARAA